MTSVSSQFADIRKNLEILKEFYLGKDSRTMFTIKSFVTILDRELLVRAKLEKDLEEYKLKIAQTMLEREKSNEVGNSR